MNYVVNTSAIKGTVKRSLSIIGKRAVDDNGNLLFEDVTLGSKEESIIEDYITNAVTDVAGALTDLVTSWTGSTLTIDTPSNKKCSDNVITTVIDAYIVSYSLYSWFVITAPKIADKYQTDMNSQLASLVRLCLCKDSPQTPSGSYTDINGSVE